MASWWGSNCLISNFTLTVGLCFTSYIAKDASHTRISPRQRCVQSESVPNNDHQITHYALFRSAAVLYQAQHLILWTTKDALLTTYTLCRSPKMHPATIKLCVRHFYARQLFNTVVAHLTSYAAITLCITRDAAHTLHTYCASQKMHQTHFKHIAHLKRCSTHISNILCLSKDASDQIAQCSAVRC